jgi:hypothetical protein
MEKPGLNAYALKMTAIIGMALQHTAIVLGDVVPPAMHFPMQFAGGLTFPVMAFFVAEGYRHTSNLQKYMGRIFIFALIAQIPYMLAFGPVFFTMSFHPNIMFTIFIGLAMLVIYDKMRVRELFWALFIIISIATLLFDWGIIGPAIILMYHAIKSEPARRIAVPMAACGGLLALSIIQGADIGSLVASPRLMFLLGVLCTIPLLLLYNGRRGRSMKYLFYIFYPLHLLILALIALSLGIGGHWHSF